LFQIFITSFLGILVEAIPFLLLGSLASGLVEIFFSPEDLEKVVPGRLLPGVVVGCLLGLFFPVGECGVMPLTRRLFKKGVSLPVGVAFLLAAPVVNPIAMASTLAAFGLTPVFWERIGLTLLVALVTGLVLGKLTEKFTPELPLFESSQAHPPDGGAEGPGKAKDKLVRALTVAVDDFFEFGGYLVVGAILAALARSLIPQSILLEYRNGLMLPVLAMISLSVLLSVSSIVDPFIALGFGGLFASGSVLAFLVYGPMVDIKNIVLYQRVFPRRIVLYVVLLPLLMTLLAGVVINLIG
jgi:uncharacterized protein